jgi:hypothetical protein
MFDGGILNKVSDYVYQHKDPLSTGIEDKRTLLANGVFGGNLSKLGCQETN